MLGIKGLQTLVETVRLTGVTPSKVHITGGVTKIKHGIWIIASPEAGVREEGYGLRTLLDLMVNKPEMVGGASVARFIGVSPTQESIIEFGVETETEDEMIKMKTQLKTQMGDRQVTGQGGQDEGTGHESLVSGLRTPATITGGEKEAPTEGLEGTQVDTLTTEGEGDTSESESTTDLSQPDFEFAATLQNPVDNAGSKVALEAYAAPFGVDLKRNMSFDNMMVEFKAAFEA